MFLAQPREYEYIGAQPLAFRAWDSFTHHHAVGAALCDERREIDPQTLPARRTPNQHADAALGKLAESIECYFAVRHAHSSQLCQPLLLAAMDHHPHPTRVVRSAASSSARDDMIVK